MTKLTMREKKEIIQQTLKEQNSLEIEKLAKDNQQTLLDAIVEWIEMKDIDYRDFRDQVSEVLIDRLERESVKLNVIKNDSSYEAPDLHKLFLEL